MVRYLPNLITFSRIALIPVMLFFYFSGMENAHWFALITFVVAGVSDGIDGFIARRWNATSQLGQFLDPIADKLIIASAAIAIAGSYDHWWYSIAAILIIGRDIIVSALREWATSTEVRSSLQVSWWGKSKTFVQFWALSLLIFGRDFIGIDIRFIGDVLLVISTVLSLWSMVSYMYAVYSASQK